MREQCFAFSLLYIWVCENTCTPSSVGVTNLKGQGLDLLAWHLAPGQPRGHFMRVEHRPTWIAGPAAGSPDSGPELAVSRTCTCPMTTLSLASLSNRAEQRHCGSYTPVARISHLCVWLGTMRGPAPESTDPGPGGLSGPFAKAPCPALFKGAVGSGWDACVRLLPCSSERTISDLCSPQAD